MFFFFFSSRRRHTRCLSDWSSDVCSSDLHRISSRVLEESEHRDAWHFKSRGVYCASPGLNLLEFLRHIFRSEERRVGKECRYRRSPYHYKEKKSIGEIHQGRER